MEFKTSDMETAPAQPKLVTRVADVTVDTLALLSSNFADRSHHKQRLQLTQSARDKSPESGWVNECLQAKALDNQSAADELKALFSSPSLTSALSKSGTEWRFILKRAPWFGGFWERLIGLTKLTLKKVLRRAFTTLNSLQTIIVEIEAILNDRPLTYVPTDANDPDPITPAHLQYSRKISLCTVSHDPTAQPV